MTTATKEQTVLETVPKQLFIGGEWRDGSRGTLAVEDPATGEALGAAADAPAEWAHHPPRERGEILRRSFEAIMDRVDDLSLLMTLEMGKSVAESKAEVSYAAEFLRWFAEQA